MDNTDKKTKKCHLRYSYWIRASAEWCNILYMWKWRGRHGGEWKQDLEMTLRALTRMNSPSLANFWWSGMVEKTDSTRQLNTSRKLEKTDRQTNRDGSIRAPYAEGHADRSICSTQKERGGDACTLEEKNWNQWRKIRKRKTKRKKAGLVRALEPNDESGARWRQRKIGARPVWHAVLLHRCT